MPIKKRRFRLKKYQVLSIFRVSRDLAVNLDAALFISIATSATRLQLIVRVIFSILLAVVSYLLDRRFMESINQFFDGVQLVAAVLMILFVVFYFVFREDIRELERDQLRGGKK